MAQESILDVLRHVQRPLMKRPRPSAPSDAPLGIVRLGGEMEWFCASLHVTDKELVPEEITRLLGEQPTESQTKDIPLLREDGSVRRIPRFGRWSRTLRVEQTDEWDVAEVVRMLFEGLPDSHDIWNQVAEQGEICVSLGLAVSTGSQDFAFDSELIKMLADRSAAVWFDVYRETEDDIP